MIWFFWLVLFIWLVSFNQANQTDQINKRNKPALALHAPRPVALADFFSILLGLHRGGVHAADELCDVGCGQE